ncbi:hypothetical protein EV672_10663 [Aquabacterium commune]|uniref:Dolichyl-phosphate-mannose-protein mannosyltransferase n=2 Tax=Aquabacterium TaxID=92793 RepID=A0A4R6R850_9BURK|nr:hypothetical protein [Aquabacterium commune]TDP82109.1 hypothetical protein EV672_10663 [Aquabacterium commune]
MFRGKLSPMPSVHQRFAEWALACLLALFVLWSGAKRPDHDWDVIGYVAAALHADGLRGVDLHRHTYDSVRHDVGERQFARLVDPSDPYRAAVYASPAALEQNVHFYAIRVLHVSAMRVISKLAGCSPSRALAWLNGVAGALAVFACFGLLRAFSVPVWLLPVLLWWAGVRDVAKLSTPDVLACWLALSSMLALAHQRWRLALVCASLLPLARTDAVLWSLMVAMAVVWMTSMRWQPLLAAVLSLMVCAAINHLCQNPGHLVIFNFTLIQKHPWPASQPVATDWHVYAAAYARGVMHAIGQPDFLLWPLAVLLLFAGRCMGRLHHAVVLVSLCYVLLHMLLFPLYLQRFFVAPIFLVSTLLFREAWFWLKLGTSRVPTQ